MTIFPSNIKKIIPILSLSMVIGSFSELRAQTDALPCNLDSSVLPLLTLIGERHESTGRSEDDLMAQYKRRKTLIEEALQGRQFIGFEYYFANNPSDQKRLWQDINNLPAEARPKISSSSSFNVNQLPVFGIEDEFAAGIGVAPDLYATLHQKLNTRNLSAVQELTLASISLWLRDRYLHEAWENVKASNPYLNPEVVQLFDRFVALSRTSENFDETREKYQFEITRIGFAPFMNAFRKTLEERLGLAETNYKRLKQVPDLTPAKNLLKDPTNPAVEGEFINKISITYRDLFFVKNTAQLYCRAIQAHRGLTLIVGALHLPGIEKALLRMSNDRIPIQKIDETQPSDKNTRLRRVRTDSNGVAPINAAPASAPSQQEGGSTLRSSARPSSVNKIEAKATGGDSELYLYWEQEFIKSDLYLKIAQEILEFKNEIKSEYLKNPDYFNKLMPGFDPDQIYVQVVQVQSKSYNHFKRENNIIEDVDPGLHITLAVPKIAAIKHVKDSYGSNEYVPLPSHELVQRAHEKIKRSLGALSYPVQVWSTKMHRQLSDPKSLFNIEDESFTALVSFELMPDIHAYRKFLSEKKRPQ